jgi:hypothetical protein
MLHVQVFSELLKIYIIINFKIYKINWDIWKLVNILIFIYNNNNNNNNKCCIYCDDP